MSILKKLKSKPGKKKPVSSALRLIAYFDNLKDQGLIKIDKNAIYIYRVLLSLGQSPSQFEKNLELYAMTKGLIRQLGDLRIIDIETDEIIK